MYRIELYGAGYKDGDKIKAIAGICYVTNIEGCNEVIKDNILERKSLQKGNIMNIATIDSTLISGSTSNIISTTLNTQFGKATVFGIRFNEIVTSSKKDKFLKYIKRFPTIVTAFIK